MGNPHIIEKVSAGIIFMTLAIAIWMAVSSIKQIDKCKDNNAVAVKSVAGYVCVKNTAITEVE